MNRSSILEFTLLATLSSDNIMLQTSGSLASDTTRSRILSVHAGRGSAEIAAIAYSGYRRHDTIQQ